MNHLEASDSLGRRIAALRKSFYKFSRNPLSLVGLGIVVMVVLLALLGPAIAPYPEHAGAFVNLGEAKRAPSWGHVFGTDVVGRDVFSRVLFALRPALLTGIVVLAIIVPIGTLLGMTAGYFSGTWVDTLVMRVADIFLGVPPLILALAICSVVEPTLMNSMIAVSVSAWPWYTRLVYGMTNSLRNEYFVKAAELMGASKVRILFKEIFPNLVSPLFTKMTLDMAWVIMLSAALSFVGLGEQPPAPSLGNMVADGGKYIPDQWWIAVFPALTIVVIVLGFNLLGDGLRDMLTVEDS